VEQASPIVLLICDDHRTLTDALSMIVARDPALRMPSPPVQSPKKAIELCRQHRPDVVLMDVMFNGPMNGIEATRQIKDISPSTNVVIMTGHEDEHLLIEAVEAGASGFLSKAEAADEVLNAAKAAAAGEVLIDPDTLTRLLRQISRQRKAQRRALMRFDELTKREVEILQLLAQGMRVDDIGTRLEIRPTTVQTHIRNTLYKLGVHSKLEAVAYAVKNGVITV